MFADHDPIPEIVRSLNAGSGPGDLTLISGCALAQVDPAIGTGAVGREYAKALRGVEVPATLLSEIEAEINAAELQKLGERLSGFKVTATPDQARVIDGLVAAAGRAVGRSLF
jgi:hypothetical protein